MGVLILKVLEDQSEITDVLSKGVEPADVTKDELEVELEALVKEDRQEMDQNVDSLSDLLSDISMAKGGKIAI